MNLHKSSPHQSPHLSCIITWYSGHPMTKPIVGVGSGRGLDLSSVTLNCLMMFVKKRNISVCARAIPRHWRLPTRKGIKRSSFTKSPDSSRNLSGLSSLGFVQYSGSLRIYQRKAKTVVQGDQRELRKSFLLKKQLKSQKSHKS